MNNAWEYLKGKKTYIGLGLGAVVVLANHLGIPIPGVQVNSNDYIQSLWELGIIAAIRNGVSTEIARAVIANANAAMQRQQGAKGQ